MRRVCVPSSIITRGNETTPSKVACITTQTKDPRTHTHTRTRTHTTTSHTHTRLPHIHTHTYVPLHQACLDESHQLHDIRGPGLRLRSRLDEVEAESNDNNGVSDDAYTTYTIYVIHKYMRLYIYIYIDVYIYICYIVMYLLDT